MTTPLERLRHHVSGAIARGEATPIAEERAAVKSAYTFARTCSFMGVTEYEVRGDGPAYRIELRRELGAYERSITNGGANYIARMVEPTIGKVRRHGDPCRPIAQEVVEAFNAWRAASHASDMAHLKAHPERYGDFAEIEANPLFAAPVEASAVHLAPDCSAWVSSQDAQARSA